MDLWTTEWWLELAIQLLIAVLTTVLGMLTYDRKVARPKMTALRDRLRRHEDRIA
ncbi:MAG: hypothetical protein GX649_15325 [Chloroflexi bacterium]|nr:hypothetical protein [Chloroflexota bacterium]